MALDALVDSTQLDSDLTDVADAIRAKTGGTAPLAFPNEFISEIGSISGGTFQLLAQGVFTNNSNSSPMTIPVNYNGLATCVYVVARTETANVARTTAWLNGTINIASSTFSALGDRNTIVRQHAASNGITRNAYADKCTLINNEINCYTCTGAYYPDIATYDWYIWGVK